ncbi:MAG TPA: M20/M25/M40 family metallo-hydrolase, partial [Limnochordia bacterium]|nr:M20/M25/M40 family metallo-hydrolase [Limnochordia bacterium]
PDRCVVTFDRRVIPGETPEQALKEFAEAVEEYCLRTGSRVEIEQPFTRDIPMEVPAEAEIVAVTRAAARQILGEATVTGAPYSCDATKMTAAGIPTIVFGPGDIAQAHAQDEFIEVDQILRAVAVLTEIAWSFGQGA